MDVKKMQARLHQLEQSNKRSNNLWKPPPGDSIIRLLPYSFDKDSPFVELWFHYGINNKTYLSPITFGRPDPIEEFANKLTTSGIQEDYKLGKLLEAKMRTYAPIIVRGEEDEGVRFWGFGKMVYQELMSIMVDPEYGDITDLHNGTDITVQFQTAKELNTSFPKTTVRAKRNASPTLEDRAKLDKLMDGQTRIEELYPEQSYDDLVFVLNDYLKLTPENEEKPSPSVTASELANAGAATPDDIDSFFNEDKS